MKNKNIEKYLSDNDCCRIIIEFDKTSIECKYTVGIAPEKCNRLTKSLHLVEEGETMKDAVEALDFLIECTYYNNNVIKRKDKHSDRAPKDPNQSEIASLRNEVKRIAEEMSDLKKAMPRAGNAVHSVKELWNGSNFCLICRNETDLSDLVWLDRFNVACERCYMAQNKS